MKQSRRSFVRRALTVGATAGLVLNQPPAADASALPAMSAASAGRKAPGANAQHERPLYFFEDNFAERRNMAWRVEPGQLAQNPLMAGQYPWDAALPFYNGTVLKDPIDGLWKCWAIVVPEFDNYKWGEWDLRMGYATSEDGLKWVRPMLAGFPCMGHEKSNVLLDLPDGGACYQMS